MDPSLPPPHATITNAIALYQHTKRPEWGLAVKVWKADERSNYQFEDGKLRSISDEFEHLLREVDRPRDEAEQLQQELSQLAGMKIARKKARENTGRALISVDQQVRLFNIDHPGAFNNEEWKRGVRGVGAPRRSKRHRDAAIADAQAAFGHAELVDMVTNLRHEEIIARAIEVLSKTNLVSDKDLDPLRALTERDMRSAASALTEQLYGEGTVSVRMQRWIEAASRSGHRVSWQLVTAIPALVHPSEHVCVRANVFAEQARWLVPRMRVAAVPSGTQYARFRKMAATLLAELGERELGPVDMVDVHEFIWETLRPAARKRIGALPTEPGDGVPPDNTGGSGDSDDELAAA